MTAPADPRWDARPLLPELALIAATIAYGTTFVIVQHALEHVTPVGFILLRFSIGTIVLAPIAFRRRAPAGRGDRRDRCAPFVIAARPFGVTPGSRLLVPERGLAAHDHVELRVHHRTVRRVHADHRGDRHAACPRPA